MIVQSRADIAKCIDAPKSEILETIKNTDAYFQKSFFSLFKQAPPLSLCTVTHITKEFTEHADRIS